MANTYTTYKDSGIPWIGEIPKEWKVTSIGMYFDEIKNPNIGQKETNTLQFKMGDIISKKGGDSKYNPESIEAYNVVEPGTIMLNGLNLSFDLISQRVAQVHEKGAITSTYLAIKPKQGLYSDYAKYLLKSYDNCKAIHAMGRGLRATLSYYSFRSEPLIIPTPVEQESIANFLDEKCSEIDALISLQEKMIDELKAYKQSVITEVVTKGLDRNVKMKDSDIDWIGIIPEYWHKCKLKNLCIFINGDRSQNYPQPDEYKSDGIPFLGADSLVDRYVDCNFARFISEEKYNSMGGLKIQIGDILYTLRGSTIGKNAICSFNNGTVASSLMGIRVNNRGLSYNYLYYWLNSEMEAKQRDSLINGATAPNLSALNVGEYIIYLPSIDEQKQIATFLDTKCSQIDSLISIKEKKIEELKDYKKSLIYEYVTGKKRV